MLDPYRLLTQEEVDSLIDELLKTQEKENPGPLTRLS